MAVFFFATGDFALEPAVDDDFALDAADDDFALDAAGGFVLDAVGGFALDAAAPLLPPAVFPPADEASAVLPMPRVGVEGAEGELGFFDGPAWNTSGAVLKKGRGTAGGVGFPQLHMTPASQILWQPDSLKLRVCLR